MTSSPQVHVDSAAVPIYVHRHNPLFVVRMIFGIVFLGLALLLLLATIAITGSEEAPGFLFACFIIPMLIFFGITIFTFLTWWRARHHQVAVYPHGLQIRTHTGEQFVAVEQIVQIWAERKMRLENFILSVKVRRLKLVLQDGQEVIITTWVDHLEQLEQWIQQQVVNRYTPQLLAALQAGQSIQLGPVQLDQQGVSVYGQQLGWHSIDHASLQPRHVFIVARGNAGAWAKPAIGEIPNAGLLVHAINTYPHTLQRY